MWQTRESLCGRRTGGAGASVGIGRDARDEVGDDARGRVDRGRIRRGPVGARLTDDGARGKGIGIGVGIGTGLVRVRC